MGCGGPSEPLGKWTGGARAGPLSNHAPGSVSFCLFLEGARQERAARVGERFMAGFWWHSQLHFAGSKDASKPCEVQVEISSFRNARLAEWAADKIAAPCSATQQLFKAPELLLKCTESRELDRISYGIGHLWMFPLPGALIWGQRERYDHGYYRQNNYMSLC